MSRVQGVSAMAAQLSQPARSPKEEEQQVLRWGCGHTHLPAGAGEGADGGHRNPEEVEALGSRQINMFRLKLLLDAASFPPT